jgi:hypothetical protein
VCAGLQRVIYVILYKSVVCRTLSVKTRYQSLYNQHQNLDKVIIIYGLKRNLKTSAPDSPLVEQAYGHVTRSYKFLSFMVPCLNSVHLFPDTVSCRPTHSSFRFSLYLFIFFNIKKKKKAPIDFASPFACNKSRRA